MDDDCFLDNKQRRLATGSREYDEAQAQRRSPLHHRLPQALPALTDHNVFASTSLRRPNSHLIDSLLQYFPARDNNGPAISKEQLLLNSVQCLLNSIQDKHCENLALLQRISDLLGRLSTVQVQLHATLKQVTITLPPHRHKLTAAQCDHLSAMIESSLVKMSLLRARAHRSLYGAISQNGTEPEHEATIYLALGTAYRKLNAEEALMCEEEKELDKKLAEYEDLLNVVDGDSSGFQQIVNDWTKVRKETEECRRDLRRLGWTGD